jgi:hypothetical protein
MASHNPEFTRLTTQRVLAQYVNFARLSSEERIWGLGQMQQRLQEARALEPGGEEAHKLLLEERRREWEVSDYVHRWLSMYHLQVDTHSRIAAEHGARLQDLKLRIERLEHDQNSGCLACVKAAFYALCGGPRAEEPLPDGA